MAEPTLRLALLGAPLAEVDGHALDVDTRKATALLAYLAVEGGTHRRSTVAALLWPDYDDERARAALRRTLSTLRHALGGAFVVVTRETVALDPTGVELDVARFRELAAVESSEARERAVQLHRGPFMAGFGLRDSAAFDDWQSLQSGRLARELGAVLDLLTAELARQGDLQRAVRHATARLALDQLHEPAHHQLMDLYARSGDRGAALAQYRECVRVLHRELGVSPLESTTELYRAIREGVSASPPPADPVLAPPARSRPLVGRDGDVHAAQRAFAAVDPDGRLLVVEGEAGIGKTRFVAELERWSRSQGAHVAGAHAFEGESGLAYGTVVELLRAAIRSGTVERVPEGAREEAARLVPELGAPAPGSLDDPGARARFYEGVTSTLVDALGSQPVVLVVDDVHWADASSLELLAYLARRLEGRRLLLVLTWRPEETPTGHPARHVLRRAQADGLASTVRLSRLSRDEVGQLAAGDGLSPTDVDRLFAETNGVPFFVCEYLDAGVGDWLVPAGVRELVEAKLAATTDVAGQVAAAGAVLGRSFDVDTVRDVSGRSDEEVVAALDELVARGILEERAASYDFRHEQTRNVAYERTSTGRRRLLHGRAADVLAAGARGGTAAGMVGQHLQAAGREPEAAEWYFAAGMRAQELRANAEARAHFEEALALGYSDGAALNRSIGDLLTLDGRYGEALRSYEAAAALADDEDERAAIEHRIGLVHDRRGEWQLADDAYGAALALANSSDSALRARVFADRSLTAHRRSHDEDAQALAAQALELAVDAEDERAAAQAHNILGILAGARGDLGEARDHAERSLELAVSLEDDVARIAALNNLALIDRADDQPERALERTREARRLCTTVGDRHREAALANNEADLLHAVGRSDEAMATLKDAVSIFAEIGDTGDLEPEIWKLREW